MEYFSGNGKWSKNTAGSGGRGNSSPLQHLWWLVVVEDVNKEQLQEH
jgi:hypothetical protein